MKNRLCVVVSALVVSLSACGASHAGLVITFAESGSDVTATLSGSFASLPAPSSQQNNVGWPSAVRPANGTVFAGTQSSTSVSKYSFSSISILPFGTNNNTDSSTADTVTTNFSVMSDALRLPIGAYPHTGTTFSGVMTWTGQTLATMGITPGTYSKSLAGGDAGATVTVNVVPEPSGVMLAGIAVAALAATGFRRRQAWASAGKRKAGAA